MKVLRRNFISEFVLIHCNLPLFQDTATFPWENPFGSDALPWEVKAQQQAEQLIVTS